MKEHFTKLIRKCLTLGLLLMFMGVQQVYAQQTVTGLVTDENDEGIPGANVLIQGTSSGGVSDADGNFRISAANDDVLVISFVGYETQTIGVDGRSVINVKMAPDIQSLEEIVVIGYGTAKKKDLTGAVAKITPEAFENQPITRVEEALQGRAAGVTVARANGAPGAGIKIRIRGVNSITGNNDPLVVIDGILGGDISTLNPNDIGSIDVLKDASATAIYGVRGSNGVIIITTKKGEGKGKVNVDYFTTISQVPELLPTLAESVGDFARIENIRRVNTGGNPIFTDADIAGFEANGGTNYQDEILQTGTSHNVALSASGSEGNISYFLSGNYRDEQGIVINTGYEQLSLRSNIEANISEKLTVGLNLYGSRSQAQNDFAVFGNGQGSNMYKAATWDPTTPIFDENGEYNLRSRGGIGSLNDNPVRTLRESDIQDIDEQLNGTLNVSYALTDNLTYTLVTGGQIINFNREVFDVEVGDDFLPHTSFFNNKTTTYQVSNILTWQKQFGDHDLKLTGVQEYQNIQFKRNGFNANDLILPNGFFFAELAPNAGQTINNNFTKRELSSYMLRAEYVFGSNLFVTATGRYDGTSVFRPGNKWGFFPSVAVAYNLNNVVENSTAFSALKLRAGWGQVGNQGVAPFSTFARLGFNSYAFDGASASAGTVLAGFESPDLTWETTSQVNVGVDIGLFDGRGSISIDGYRKNTTDLLLDVPVLDTNGGGTITQNVGEVENFGIDLTVGYDILSKEDLNWSTNFSLTYVKNEVTKLFRGLDQIDGLYTSPGGQSRVLNIIQLGQPLGQFQGATFLGTWKTSEAAAADAFGKQPGDAKYLRDADGEIVFDPIGNGTPELLWGFNNTVNYKNWDLNVFLQGVHGFDVYNIMQAGITGGAGDSRSFMAADQVNQWTPENETDIPATVQFFNSSRYVEKGDFIRLSNITVGYTFQDIGLGDATIKIYAGAQNLFLITDYSGYDPELSSRKGNQGNEDVAPGINIGAYPNPRTYTFGVKLGF
ncbi:MAG: SusC/RagA family TonB-linked outer membrane protein [Cyclobacteriaceae bacterium]